MKTKYDIEYCPCGCGNHNQTVRTQDEVDSIRKDMDGRRFCMERDTTKICLASLEDIRKKGYRKVEEYTLQEFLGDAETEHDKWAMTSLYRNFTTLNMLADSKDNRIDV